ncbi:mucoidy inhibitor MuiA family protein [Sulfitobacter pseudonitzschiae]|uniref:Mucoidy inhibitor MuiA family protein n=1 Tax=Pseudosulfitobacter pseudonitzschiae TaxID=1402135 RepID=A0A9Q2NXK1_9RHOB|nr:DUF4139 domain-containing protein [Pseudosulfitobacter pseudonitzschiae]MBM2290453.1 mucoidy inhibitor MuiA family protein [Pseudosulfitobacter pseudonitzschiae]MBM2295371.1 mucoidy inhibitor MuiA family protein [Pseudosulfitobacter pseudonitzschiae]MBM2300283.1 mucoidy inhibitor MuiA family protein [Pseudosulfitobacter pseudonitzschiae]MBM2310068.1 mucoidy inhibitor MuiA family protein [Pseudosulfitobacter pseudonitzschiae]MBM2314980.1 mucoidy inhibitor MuiA family protein [Pseudosulfitoba
MRFAILAPAVSLSALLAPLALWADTLTVDSAPSAVTVYPYGAQVTRTATVTLPQGTHDLVLPDLPQNVDPGRISVKLAGAQLQSVSFRDRNQPPRPDQDTPEVTAARDALKAAETALNALDDRIALAQVAVQAAKAQTDFLTALGTSEALPMDVGTLRELAQMIGDQTLVAGQAAGQAQTSIRILMEERKDRIEDVADAQAALDALLTADQDRTRLTLTATAQAAGKATVEVSYQVDDAAWAPVYNLRLTTGDTPSLELERGAAVRQFSGEDWGDVSMTLATVQPSGQTWPGEIYSELRRIEDPAKPKARMNAEAALGAAADMAPPSPVPEMIQEPAMAVAMLDGPSVQYAFPRPVSVANGADDVRIALDKVDFDADVYARAVPLSDSVAYRMARMTNTTQEQLLGTDLATAFVDGQMVGQFNFAPVAPGQEVDIAFGPIETLRLNRVRLNRNEGDRGIISRSNEITEATRIDLENTGTKPWRVELFDRVPVSEQEDLEIDWSAQPAPTVTDHEDRKGVLMWDMTVAPGDEANVTLEVDMSWPEGKILR